MDTREDQLLRQEKFLKAHPHVEITHQMHPEWAFHAVWFDRGERHEQTAGYLGLLLDALEGPDGPA